MSDITYMTWDLDFTRRRLTKTNNAEFVQHDENTDIIRVTAAGVDQSSSSTWNVLYKLESTSTIYKSSVTVTTKNSSTIIDWTLPASLLDAAGQVGFVICRKNTSASTDWNTIPTIFTVEASYAHSNTVVPKETVDEMTSALQKAVDNAKSIADSIKSNTLKIGGRNLARGTNQGTTYWRKIFEKHDECTISEDTGSRGERCVKCVFSGYTSTYHVVGYNDPHLPHAFKGLTGQTIVVSFDAKSDKAMSNKISFRNIDATNSFTDDYSFSVSGSGAWEHKTISMTIRSDTASSQLLHFQLDISNKPTYLEIGNLKIEVGTVASDWSPAPEDLLLEAMPIGYIYISVNSTSPADLFGGTWTSLGGRFLLGADSTYTAGSTGGEATHTLTTAEMPAHAHNLSSDARAHSFYWGMTDADVYANATAAQGTGSGNQLGTKQTDWATTATTGKGQAHNNMPPYLAVHMWQRTA